LLLHMPLLCWAASYLSCTTCTPLLLLLLPSSRSPGKRPTQPRTCQLTIQTPPVLPLLITLADKRQPAGLLGTLV
jgi:hypothetical protein